MSVRLKRYSAESVGNPGYGSILDDTTQTQRETTVDGYTFHWGPNEVRNFLDDGVGLAHASFPTVARIIQNTIPFNDSMS